MSVFELRIYHAAPGKLDAMLARFRDHTVALFTRHNMKSVGYFVPQDAPDSDKLIYILQHPSREAAESNWAAFQADPEWKAVKAGSEGNGPLVAKIERWYMDPTDFSAMQ